MVSADSETGGASLSATPGATFVYRGQLHVEASRIRFLLSVACATFETVDIVLLSPGLGASESDFRRFGAEFASVRNVTFLQARRFGAARVRHQLAKLIAADAPIVIGVG